MTGWMSASPRPPDPASSAPRSVTRSAAAVTILRATARSSSLAVGVSMFGNDEVREGRATPRKSMPGRAGFWATSRSCRWMVDTDVFQLNTHVLQCQSCRTYYARGDDDVRSDVDLLVVGGVNVPALLGEIQTLEAKLGRELSPVAWTEDDFDRQVQERSPFLTTVRAEPKIWIVGDEDEFERRTRELARPSPRRRAADQPRPARRRAQARPRRAQPRASGARASGRRS